MTTPIFARSALRSHPVSRRGNAWSRACAAFHTALLCSLVSASLGAGTARAQLRDYTVRWLPSPSSGVEGYQLSVGTTSGSYDSTFDLGLPVQQNGELRFAMELEGSVDLHLALRAYGGGQLSPYSNEVVVARVEVPTDPATPTFGVSAIQGITGVVSGQVIVSADTFGSTESVKFLIDGVSYRIENAAPWSLAGDSGEPGTENAFDTKALVDGEHTITAIAYSQDAASGVEGAAVSVTFHVDNSLPGTPSPDPSPTPEPTPEPTPDPGPVDGPEGAVAGLFATSEGDIVALRVDGSSSVLIRSALAAGGDLRPVWCDLDGDEDRDLVVGFGPGSGARVLVLMMEDLAVVETQTITTAWPIYQQRNGETYPGCGDVDGDRRNELVIGLGAGSVASMMMLDDRDSGFRKMKVGYRGRLLSMPSVLTLGMEYAQNGSSKPVLADIDGDGLDEIVVGRSQGARGTVSVMDDAQHDFTILPQLSASLGLIEVVPDAAYQESDGSTQVAVGDIDGDGLAEIVVGTGESGGSRLFVYDDAVRGFAGMADSASGLEFGHDGYNVISGVLKPTLADIDGDGLPEVALGFGEGGEGQIQLLDDLLTNFAPLAWTGNVEGIVVAPNGTGMVSSALEPNSR